MILLSLLQAEDSAEESVQDANIAVAHQFTVTLSSELNGFPPCQ
jgi:hypothetical protein